MTSGKGPPDAAYYDQWYADIVHSPAYDAIVARTLGLPPDLQSTSLLTWQGIATVTDALRLPTDGLLADVACGRGGYGIEIARRTGARLVGVDFSAVALEQARSNGARLLPDGRSEFRLGTMLETGLPSGVAHGLMCIDAVQFAAESQVAALREFRRILTSGGRAALTCWEAVDPTDERIPPGMRAVNLTRDLSAAGFVDVQVHEQPGWREAERAMWEDALAAVQADAAVTSMQEEGRRVLAMFDMVRRVFATATAP